MNRREFEEHLRANGCGLLRHGARHDIWTNPVSRAKAGVPRHRLIRNVLARANCKQLGVAPPPSL